MRYSQWAASRKTLHVDIIRRGIVTERVQTVLSPIIMDIESGKICFRRVRQEWQILYLEPPLRPLPPQPG
jgi:hypothetical protein